MDYEIREFDSREQQKEESQTSLIHNDTPKRDVYSLNEALAMTGEFGIIERLTFRIILMGGNFHLGNGIQCPNIPL